MTIQPTLAAPADQARLDTHTNGACPGCGRPIGYEERLAMSEPYVGAWRAIVERIVALSPDVAVYQRDLSRWVAEIVDAQPKAKGAFALATTRYGREGEQGR